MLIPNRTRSYGFESVFKKRVFSGGSWSTDVDDFIASSGSAVRVAPPVIYWISGAGTNRLFYMGENFEHIQGAYAAFDVYTAVTPPAYTPVSVENSWQAPFRLSCAVGYGGASNFDQHNLVGVMYGNPWAGAAPSTPFPTNPSEPFVFLGCRTDTDQYMLAWAVGDGSALQRVDLTTNSPAIPNTTHILEICYRPGVAIEARANNRALGSVTSGLPSRTFGYPTRGAGVFAATGGLSNSRQDGAFFGLEISHATY